MAPSPEAWGPTVMSVIWTSTRPTGILLGTQRRLPGRTQRRQSGEQVPLYLLASPGLQMYRAEANPTCMGWG